MLAAGRSLAASTLIRRKKMFKNPEQMILSFLIAVFAAVYFRTLIYKHKKDREYGDDPRWKMIQLKAKSFGWGRYGNIISIILAVPIIIGLIWGDLVQWLTTSRSIAIIFGFLVLESVIEYLGCRYYEKREL